MATKYPVKYFDSNMSGAPSLSGTAQPGQLIALIEACLLNGFGSKTLDSLTVSGTEAVMLLSGGHTFKRGDVVEVFGANEAVLNAEWKVTWASPSQAKFTVPAGTPNGTGTIGVKYAPQGDWEKASGCPTNYGLYRSKLTEGSECALWINDNSSGSASPASFAGNNSAQTTSVWHKRKTPFSWGDPDHEYPRYNGSIFYQRAVKSNTNSTNNKAWFVVADPYGFYYGLKSDGGVNASGGFDNSTYWTMHYYGDIPSLKAGDIFNFLVTGGIAGAGANGANLMFNPSVDDNHARPSAAYSPFWIPMFSIPATGVITDYNGSCGAFFHRFWNGMEGASCAQRFQGYSNRLGSIWELNAAMADGKIGPDFPIPANNGFLGQDAWVTDSYGSSMWSIRGKMPGLISPMVRFPPKSYMSNQRIYGVDYNGVTRDLALMQMGVHFNSDNDRMSFPHLAFDLTGPWR